MSIIQLEKIINSITAGNYTKALEEIDTVTSFNYIMAEITKEERKAFLDSLVALSKDFGKKSKEIADIFGGTSYVDTDYRIFSDGTDIQNSAELSLKGIKPYKDLPFLNGSERSLLSLFPVLDPTTKGDVVEYFSLLFSQEMSVKFTHWFKLRLLWLQRIKTKFLPIVEESIKELYDLLQAQDLLERNTSKEDWDSAAHSKLDLVYTMLESYAEKIFTSFEKSFREKLLAIAPNEAHKVVDNMFNELFKHPAVASVVTAEDTEFKEAEVILKDMEDSVFKLLKDIGAKDGVRKYLKKEITNPIKEYYIKELHGGLLSEMIPIFKTVIPPFKELIKHLTEKAVSPDKTLKGFPENFFPKTEGEELKEFDGYLKYGDSNYKIKPFFRDDKVTLKIEHPFPKEEIGKLLKKIKPNANSEDIQEAYKNISDEGFLKNYESKMKKGFKEGLKAGSKK